MKTLLLKNAHLVDPRHGVDDELDLLIVDGGKGQLSMAVDVLKSFDLEKEVPLAGLAKREEELFVPGNSRSIWLDRRSQSLYLVQRVRDEAHRFANEGHRNEIHPAAKGEPRIVIGHFGQIAMLIQLHRADEF